MLGKGHSVLLRRAELKTFVNFHGNEVLYFALTPINSTYFTLFSVSSILLADHQPYDFSPIRR